MASKKGYEVRYWTAVYQTNKKLQSSLPLSFELSCNGAMHLITIDHKLRTRLHDHPDIQAERVVHVLSEEPYCSCMEFYDLWNNYPDFKFKRHSDLQRWSIQAEGLNTVHCLRHQDDNFRSMTDFMALIELQQNLRHYRQNFKHNSENSSQGLFASERVVRSDHTIQETCTRRFTQWLKQLRKLYNLSLEEIAVRVSVIHDTTNIQHYNIFREYFVSIPGQLVENTYDLRKMRTLELSVLPRWFTFVYKHKIDIRDQEFILYCNDSFSTYICVYYDPDNDTFTTNTVGSRNVCRPMSAIIGKGKI